MALSELVDGAGQLSTLALDVASVPDPGSTISRVADLAAKLIPCLAADVVRVTGAGELRVLASSDSGLSDLAVAAWQRWPHFPAVTAMQTRTRQPNHASGYRADLASNCGVETELMFALHIGDNDHGYLRFLFQDATSPASPVGRLAAAFSIQVAIAVDRAALQVKTAGLEASRHSDRQIAAAVGILMAQRSLDYEDAFLLLRSASQNSNRKLRDVASEVLIDLASPPHRR